jgi:phosphatidylglycerol:prolipoprotein diacylglycerol transferase
MSGDGCYGPPTDLPWGIAFPNGVKPTDVTVHPTPLYEILMILPLFFLLSEKKFRNSPPGLRSFLFMFLSSLIRFLTDFWRSTSYPRLLSMTVEQIIAAIFFLLFGFVLLFILRGNHLPIPKPQKIQYSQ